MQKHLTTHIADLTPYLIQDVCSGLRIQLELNPESTAKGLLDGLINEKPGQFNINLLRTLQRRVANWRLEQMKIK